MNTAHEDSFYFKSCLLLQHSYYDYKNPGFKHKTIPDKRGEGVKVQHISNAKCTLKQANTHMKYTISFPGQKIIPKIPLMRIELSNKKYLIKKEHRLVLSQIQCIQKQNNSKYTEAYGDEDASRIHITFVVFENQDVYKPIYYLTYQFRLDKVNYDKIQDNFIANLKTNLIPCREDIPTEFEIEWIRHCESCANLSPKAWNFGKYWHTHDASPPCTKKGVSQSLMKSLALQEKYKDQGKRLYGCSPTIRGIETAFYAFQHIPDTDQVYVFPFIHEKMGAYDLGKGWAKAVEIIPRKNFKTGKLLEEITSNKPLSTNYLKNYEKDLHLLIDRPRFQFDQFETLIDNVQKNIISNNFMLFWKRVLIPLYKSDSDTDRKKLTLISHSQFIKSIFDLPGEDHDDVFFPQNLSSYIAEYDATLYHFKDNHNASFNLFNIFDIRTNYIQYGCPLIIYTTFKERQNIGKVPPKSLC